MISNGRVCEEGCIRMTESKLSMSGGRFSRSSFIGTMTEAHGRGASVMKSRPARYQRSKKSLRPHSIEGLEDGQSRRDTAVQKRNCKVASEGLHDRIPGISAARFAICSFIYSPSLQSPCPQQRPYIFGLREDGNHLQCLLKSFFAASDKNFFQFGSSAMVSCTATAQTSSVVLRRAGATNVGECEASANPCLRNI